MGKIRNSIYGLALGDATAYRTEFESFEKSVERLGNEDLRVLDANLHVSDDTQMSLYMLKGFFAKYDPNAPFVEQEKTLLREIAKQFVVWSNDPLNNRAPGIACMGAMAVLDAHLKRHPGLDDYLIGGRGNKQSKGSGTVMRAPWLGLLHALGVIPDDRLEAFSDAQASITHQHPTALHGAYLTALLTSKLYTEEIKPGDVRVWADTFIKQLPEPDWGWAELSMALRRIDELPADYTSLDAVLFDPCTVLGTAGTAENVLTAAIAFIDFFGDEPVDVLRRCVFNSGDTDTIGAVAGGMLGAAYHDDVWSEVDHLVEEHYVPWLDGTVTILETYAE